MRRLSGYLTATVLVACLTLTASFVAPISADDPQQKPPERKLTKHAWTYESARRELELNPRDPYLQYITLQLASAPGGPGISAPSQFIEWQLREDSWRGSRTRDADLFSLFNGALAVQESLQLERMSGSSVSDAARLNAQRAGNATPAKPADDSLIDIGTLNGPTIKSHPWKFMLAGKKPDVSELSRCVPADFFLIEFQSLNKLLEASEISDVWSTHLFDQAYQEAVTYNTGNRLKRQLAVETNPLLRPFYDLVVNEVAVTGSDLFLRDGSDVTLLFKFSQPLVFQARMDGFLTNARKKHPEAKQTTGKYLGVDYVHLATPDRSLSVFSAYPRPNVHVRSNSLIALQRVLAAVQGKDAAGKPVERLGETTEFQYIRTLMPRGAKEEDGFVYLSDPFIRRLVGPQVKLTGARRMQCYNHLKMIGHAATLYQTQYGRPPGSLAELAASHCSPGEFGTNALQCVDGGRYSLRSDGLTGVCSHHGISHFLNPCCEIPLNKVSASEVKAYTEFLTDYNNYWRQYFDPIALRLQVSPQRYRVETIILPLIDNSIYTALSLFLGHDAAPLEPLPVPASNIMTLAVKFDIADMLKPEGEDIEIFERNFKLNRRSVVECLQKGLGNQVGFHICDGVPTFDLNVSSMLGDLITSRGSRSMFELDSLMWTFLIGSLNSPVYASMPVKDPAVVDRFLEELDGRLATAVRHRTGRNGWFEFQKDFYGLKIPGVENCRSATIQFGWVKWRIHWARIGNGLYVASQPDTLKEIAALEKQRAADLQKGKTAAGPVGHVMIRIRPQNWQKVLQSFKLGWSENNRQACLNNLGMLTSASKALQATGTSPLDPKFAELVQLYADRLRGGHGFCPEGGHFHLGKDGTHVDCSAHGSLTAPQQPSAPNPAAPAGDLLRRFQDMTVTMTFLEDGLRAVVTVDRTTPADTPPAKH